MKKSKKKGKVISVFTGNFLINFVGGGYSFFNICLEGLLKTFLKILIKTKPQFQKQKQKRKKVFCLKWFDILRFNLNFLVINT